MTMIVVSSFCLSLMLLMPAMMQPLSLGLCIMVLSVMSCVLVGLSISSWYGYILFLVYVGGLLVMFAYVAALAPNSFFSSTKAFVVFFVSLLLIKVGLWVLFTPGSGVLSSGMEMGGDQFVSASGICITSPSGVSIIIVLGVILLISLLAVVKICYYQQGPLRPHFELK